MATTENWYEAKMGNDHQGLIANESTGANVAVVYDKRHARLIAAAPDLLEALERLALSGWRVGAEDRQFAIRAIAKARS